MRITFQNLPKDLIGLPQKQGLSVKLGEILDAKVIKAGPERALLELKGKTVLADVKLNLKPGDELKVRVTGELQNKIILKVMDNAPIPSNPLEQLLKQAGVTPSPNARSALAFLLRNGLPVTTDTLRALITDKEKPLMQLLLKTFNSPALLPSRLPSKTTEETTHFDETVPDKKTAKMSHTSPNPLSQSVSKTDKILAKIPELASTPTNETQRSPEADNRLEQLKLALNPGHNPGELAGELKIFLQKLGFASEPQIEKSLDEPETLPSLLFKPLADEEAQGVRELADKLLGLQLRQSEENLLLHIELPLFFNQTPSTAILQIREDEAGEQDCAGKKPLSIYLQLETDLLGHLRALILLRDAELSCQFSSDREETRRLLRKSLPELTERFRAMSYQVSNMGVSTLVETIEKPEPLPGQVNFRV